MSPKKILIIGAGASGIAAATRLYENGIHDFIVLEAENRIGGRVHTIPFGKNAVDLGAQWCHGENGNAVFKLANPLNAIAASISDLYNFDYYRSNGTILDKAVSKKITAFITEVQSDYEDEMKVSNESLGKFIIDKVESVLATNTEYSDLQNYKDEIISIFHQVIDALDGTDNWFESSARGSTEFWNCEGNFVLNWKGRGYKTILDILLKRFPDPSTELPIIEKIQFNKIVKQINWHGECAPHQQVEVVCEDGTTYEADHVLCTVSLGVLKERHEQLFNPPLPRLKQTAIKTLGFGTIDKIYVEFAEPFWPEDWTGFNAVWDKTDLEAALAQPNNSWITEVYGFFITEHQPNILCGWISGPEARDMETHSAEEIKESVIYLLRKFITNWTVPEPVHIKTTNWYTNRNFRGSYGTHSMASQAAHANYSHLAYPLSNSTGPPVLFFGGEATHDHYFSTVHGAIETGWREGTRITETVKQANSEV